MLEGGGIGAGQRLSSLFWDSGRHRRIVRAVRRSLLMRREGGRGGGGGAPSIVLLGPTACILAILLARQVREIRGKEKDDCYSLKRKEGRKRRRGRWSGCFRENRRALSQF